MSCTACAVHEWGREWTGWDLAWPQNTMDHSAADVVRFCERMRGDG